MKRQIGFISRKDILEKVEHIIGEQDTRHIICIQAGGGIGKTRLLQEIFNRHQPIIPTVLPGNFQRKNISIILLEEFTSSEWDQQFIAGVEAMAKDLGVNFERFDAHFSPQQMNLDLDTAIARKPDAIYISLGSHDVLRAGIERAAQNGIKVLTHDNFLSVEGVAVRIMQDYIKSCDALTTHIIKDIGYEGKIVTVWQKEQVVQEYRRQALDVILKNYPDIQVVNQMSAYGDNLIEDTYAKTLETLKNYPGVRAFWVAFDELAKGVVRALYEAKRTDIGVYSFDLNPSSMDMIVQPNSPWRVTIAINPYELGRLAIRLVTLSVYEDASVERQITLPMEIFTQESLQALMQQGKNFYDNWPPSTLGYTPLIDALQKRKIEQRRGLQLLEVVDFDNHEYRIPQILGTYIAENLDATVFQPYFEDLHHLRKLEEQQSLPEQLSKTRAKVNRTFVECFNRVSQNRRIVLLFDTTEKLENSDVWDYLLFLSKNLNNVVFIFAGRTTKKIYAKLSVSVEEKSLHFIPLLPLDEEASVEYIREKTEQLGNKTWGEMPEKICFLAQGRPILIDLAVEWWLRDVSLSWMKMPLDEIKAQKGTMKKRLLEFEKALVSHISETRRPLDWLWLLMAHIHPVNEAMIAEILSKPLREAQDMLKSACSFVFVKSLPNQEIALHDEMERMINAYVWPMVDKQGVRRKLYSNQLCGYMAEQTQKLQARIDEIRIRELKSSVSGRRELNLFAEREILQSQMWITQEQQLHHTFMVSASKGCQLFVQLFDKAPIQFMELLLKEARSFSGNLSIDERFEIDTREAGYLIKVNYTADARKLLLEMKLRYNYDQRHLLDVLSKLGNCERQTGNLEKSVAYLQQAVEILGLPENKQLLAQSGGAIYNILGVVYRQMGEWDNAERYYRSAISVVKEGEDRKWLASAYINLGYITGIKSEYESALRYCRNALQIQEKIAQENQSIHFDMGRTHNVFCIIYRGKEDYGHSIEHIEKAIQIFSELKNLTWLGMAYCERGTTHWHNEKLREAERDLKYGVELYKASGAQMDLPAFLHRLGHVAWEQKKFSEAEHYFRNSAEIGNQVSDYQQIVNSLEGLVELYYYQGMEENKVGNIEKRNTFYERAEREAEKWAAQFDVPRVKFPLYTGSRLRILGNIAYDQGDYALALERYISAYPYIAQKGGYSRYMLPKALDWLQERINRLDADIALDWCDKIETDWIAHDLDRNFPEMLTTLDLARDSAKARKKQMVLRAG